MFGAWCLVLIVRGVDCALETSQVRPSLTGYIYTSMGSGIKVGLSDLALTAVCCKSECVVPATTDKHLHGSSLRTFLTATSEMLYVNADATFGSIAVRQTTHALEQGRKRGEPEAFGQIDPRPIPRISNALVSDCVDFVEGFSHV